MYKILSVILWIEIIKILFIKKLNLILQICIFNVH